MFVANVLVEPSGLISYAIRSLIGDEDVAQLSMRCRTSREP